MIPKISLRVVWVIYVGYKPHTIAYQPVSEMSLPCIWGMMDVTQAHHTWDHLPIISMARIMGYMKWEKYW